jgi:formate-dependent nitrite reductase cytochrome c552 subunit
MSDVFPKWVNRLPRNLLIGGFILISCVTAGFAYYFTPKYTRTGYQPLQPVAFSHKTHTSQIGLDCRYCHSPVEKSAHASIPASSTCMNCHSQILREDPRLALVRESATNGVPILWVRVHRMPDYTYFNHGIHTQRGVGCVECHGPIHKMEETRVAQPLSMSFCLDCHRDPAPRLRPLESVMDLDWQFSMPGITNEPWKTQKAQREFGEKLARDRNIQKLTSCNNCHR